MVFEACLDTQQYVEDRRRVVEEGLQEFIRSRYQEPMLGLVMEIAVGGKRIRGLMALLACEAAGGEPEDAMVAACAIELAHAASLVKDDAMDQDEVRRGKKSFWKQFGVPMSLLVPDIIVPDAALFTRTYGHPALSAVVTAWSKVAQGQLLDFPQVGAPGLSALGDGFYERIISHKTAPLFEVACELGVRAAKQDGLLDLGRRYGFNSGMAFQIYDDACDLIRATGKLWEQASTSSFLPVSLQALKLKLKSGPRITNEDYLATVRLAEPYMREATETAEAFPSSPVKEILAELPVFGCTALIAEAVQSLLPTMAATEFLEET